jgi:hypothetical protein
MVLRNGAQQNESLNRFGLLPWAESSSAYAMAIYKSPRNATMLDVDRATHLKIVIVSLIWATMVAGIGIAARVGPPDARIDATGDYGRPTSHLRKISSVMTTGRSMTGIATTRDSVGADITTIGAGQGRSASHHRKRPPTGRGDPDAGEFDRTPAGVHVLGSRGREPGADQVDDEPQREAMRQHDRLGASVGGLGKECEGATVTAERRHRKVGHGAASSTA